MRHITSLWQMSPCHQHCPQKLLLLALPLMHTCAEAGEGPSKPTMMELVEGFDSRTESESESESETDQDKDIFSLSFDEEISEVKHFESFFFYVVIHDELRTYKIYVTAMEGCSVLLNLHNI